jgi:ribosomal protein S12 methylthiotransferase
MTSSAGPHPSVWLDGNLTMNYYLESLGCPKNLVDAQGIARLLKHLGYQPVADPDQAQILIVNTCGFIEDARKESIDELRLLARDKRQDQVLIAAGCLSQYWGHLLTDTVPGLDALLGTRRWSEIGALISDLRTGRSEHPKSFRSLPGEPLLATPGEGPLSTRQGASAYLKIADGCSAPCGFCVIPRIKGPAVSRSPEAVIQDASDLVSQGVKELVLIAQDTTAYGRDRGQVDALPDLMQRILDASPDLHWLRLMYAYPAHVSPRLIEVMAADPRVCHYLDLPLQHAHPGVLRRMKRPAKLERTRKLVSDLRAAMPDLALRSSFIVGYPGETEEEFRALLDLAAEMRFDRVGVFLFSREEGTVAAALPGRVSQEVKACSLMRLRWDACWMFWLKGRAMA